MSYSDPRLIDRTGLGADPSDAVGSYVGQSALKRGLDLVLALVFLAATWPLIALIALVLYVRKGNRILARRPVIGRDGVEIDLIHFNADQDTVLGRWLCATTLSGLPQLWMVLRGTMSFVGPRPLELEEMGRFRKTAGLYMKARPGVSGPWRVAQERTLGAIAQARLDRSYIKSGTFFTDIGILLRTPFVLMQMS